MKQAARVLVVIPAKDEEQSVGRVLESIGAKYPAYTRLVIDDGSIDSTAEIARGKGSLVISHGKNLGVAAVIQTGRIYALEHNYDFLVFCDGDGQHNPIGSRQLGDYTGWEPLRMRLSRYFCSWVITILTRKRFTDVTSGFKGWNRSVMEHFRVVYETSDKLHLGTTNDMEEILMACKKRFKIIEIPARMQAQSKGVSKVYTADTIFHFLTIFPIHFIRTVWRNLW